MATARLIYETSENLDSRTIAHRKPDEPLHRLVLTDDTIFSVSESGITARGLDLEVKWQASHTDHIWTLEVVGDELFALDAEGVTVRSLAGEELRRFERNTDWDLSDFAIDRGDRPGRDVRPRKRGGVGRHLRWQDRREAPRVGHGRGLRFWRLARDQRNDVPRRSTGTRRSVSSSPSGSMASSSCVNGAAARTSGQYSDESWFHTGEHIVEITTEKRGLVVFDAQSLELVAQPGAHGVFGEQVGGKTFCWSDQHVTIWDGEGLRFLKPDWRGHYLLSFTPDGRSRRVGVGPRRALRSASGGL